MSQLIGYSAIGHFSERRKPPPLITQFLRPIIQSSVIDDKVYSVTSICLVAMTTIVNFLLAGVTADDIVIHRNVFNLFFYLALFSSAMSYCCVFKKAK